MVKLSDLTPAEREELASLLEEKRLRQQAKDAEVSLHAFMRMFWRVVDPEEEFVDGWAIEAISVHLEATEDGTIKRLIINVPPGFSKSLLTDVFFPAWLWGPRGRPWLRFIAASYSASLTERDNGRFSRLVNDPVYRRFWGHHFNLTRDGMTKVENDRTGWKLATSVGGVGTGERGNFILIDDPNNPLDVESDTVRQTTNQWLREIMPDRLNNLREGVIILIQQRTHEEDATGTLLKYGSGYNHLMIDMRFDVRIPRIPTAIGWVDPREWEGELAWEARFPDEVVDSMEKIKGPFAFSGQYQQQPVPRGGGIIPREMWNLWPAPGYEAPEGEKQQFPEVSFVLCCVDSASTEAEENDPSACVTLGVWHDQHGRPKIIMMDAWAERLKINKLVEKLLETGRKRICDRMLIENKANGISVHHEMQRLMVDAEFGVELWEPKGHGDKVARLYSAQPTFDRGDVYAPDKKWANKVIDEVLQVPKGAHDDLADCVSMGILWLRESGLLKTAREYDNEVAWRNTFQREPEPLYDV